MRYPTEELDELEVFLLRHDKKFCEFLSKQLGVEILDWWDISFSWEVVTCQLRLSVIAMSEQLLVLKTLLLGQKKWINRGVYGGNI